jgi:hypothetical protein
MGFVRKPGRYVRKHELLVRFAPNFVAVARVDGSTVTLVGSGAAVWKWLDEPRTVVEIANELAQVYTAESARIAADIAPLLGQLVQSGFVTADE